MVASVAKQNDRSRSPRFIWSRILLIFIPAAILLIGSGYIVYHSYADADTDSIRRNQADVTQIRASNIGEHIDEITTDLFFLAAQQDIQRMLLADGNLEPVARAELNNMFLSFSRARRLYDQIRILDANGLETVRVNFNNGNPAIVPESALQSKDGRYYFDDTMALDRGQLFVSPLDLNVENGAIEQPLKPMLRLGTPIFDSAGNKRGIVLLNYFGANLIEHVNETTTEVAGDESMMLNSDGYWLAAADESLEFGFMYPDREGASFATQQPEVWQAANADETGQLTTASGLYTYETVYPLHRIHEAYHNHSDAFCSGVSPVVSQSYHWKVISFVPAEIFYAKGRVLISWISAVVAILLIIVAYTAWRTAIAASNMRLATATVFHHNDLLEKTVAARTSEIETVNRKLKAEIAEKMQAEQVVNELNEGLEQRVIERTSQLQQSQIEMKAALQQAEDAIAAKGRFLSNMSHEIRTPMNGILGMIDLALDEVQDSEPHGYLTIAKSSAQTLLEIIGDILDVSKIEAGKLKIERINSSVDEMLRELAALMGPQAANKGIALEVAFDTPVPESMQTDPTRIRQCLLNLIGNAIKFTQEGTVRLHLSSIRYEGADCVRFDVHDTGVGISTAHQSRIFEAFEQEDDSTSRQFGGTGLGLSITRQLAVLLGGSLTVSSIVGKGSTFSLTIPQGQDPSQVPHIDSLGESAPAPKRERMPDRHFSGEILVVEDNVVNQKTIGAMLRKLGLSVAIAQDGQEAVIMATQNAYDLIFMDVQMPVMNGYDATRMLRDQGATLPIVALTANVMPSDIEMCLEAGCDEFMSKPINRKLLVATLDQFLSTQNSPDTNHEIVVAGT